jgi:mannosyltransferase
MIAVGRPGLAHGTAWLSSYGFALALCATVLLAGGLRVYALDYQSLWSDEIFTLRTTDPALTLREFWQRVLADTHPPIYYLITRVSSSIFGQSELAARAPSAIFGILTLCAAAILPGSSLSRSARLALPLLIAASPGAAWYAREARPYALLLLLSTVVTLACLRLLSAAPHDNGKARRGIAVLTAAANLVS